MTSTKPDLALVPTELPSTSRAVVIVCRSEKKWTGHKFHRIEHVNGMDRIMFRCMDCDEERTYGVEG